METIYTVHYKDGRPDKQFRSSRKEISYETYQKLIYLMDYGIEYTISRKARAGETENWDRIFFLRHGERGDYPFLAATVKIEH